MIENPLMRLYFHDIPSANESNISAHFDAFCDMFSSKISEFISKWEKERIIDISYKDIVSACGNSQPSLDSLMSVHPSEVIAALSMAAHHSINKYNHISGSGYILPFGTLYHVSIKEWRSQSWPIYRLKSELVGTFIKIRGIVIEGSIIETNITKCQATCLKCGKDFVFSRFGKQKVYCSYCHSNNFSIIDENPFYSYFQRVIIKDIMSDSILNCDFNGEIVNSVHLGEIVDLTGVLHFSDDQINNESYNNINNNNNSINGSSNNNDINENENITTSRQFQLTLEVNGVSNLNDTKGGFASSFVSVSDGDLIQSIGEIRCIFPVLVDSICLNLHPMIKAALLLSAFSSPVTDDSIHILISSNNCSSSCSCIEMFSAMERIVPHCVIFTEKSKKDVNFALALRSSIVTKNNSALRQKCGSRIKSGAFVIANQGLLMTNDVDSFKAAQMTFLEIVEFGFERIDSLRKVQTNFSSIIAADPKILAESVLKCFTLQFEVDDEVNRPRYSTPRSQQRQQIQQKQPMLQNSDLESFEEKWNNKFLPLAERLFSSNNSRSTNCSSSQPNIIAPIDPQTLLKYVTYARQFVRPVWSKPAKQRLFEIVSTNGGNCGSDVKRLKSMAKCRAKVELRSVVEKSDVEECAEILEWSRETPQVKRKQAKSSSKQRLVVDFMQEFKRIANYKENGIVDEKEMREIADLLDVKSKYISFEHFMDALTVNNLVLLSAPKKYRVGSSL